MKILKHTQGFDPTKNVTIIFRLIHSGIHMEEKSYNNFGSVGPHQPEPVTLSHATSTWPLPFVSRVSGVLVYDIGICSADYTRHF